MVLRGEPPSGLPGWGAGVLSGMGQEEGRGNSVCSVPCWLVPLPGTSFSVSLFPLLACFLLCLLCPFSSLCSPPLFPFSNPIGVFLHSGLPDYGSGCECVCVVRVGVSVGACTTLHVHACPVLLCVCHLGDSTCTHGAQPRGCLSWFLCVPGSLSSDLLYVHVLAHP